MKKPRNDGFTDLKYEIVPGRDSLNQYISALVNAAWHIHRSHPADWKRGELRFKDEFAARLGLLILKERALVRHCLNQNDRVLSMLVYRALELIDAGEDLSALANRGGYSLGRKYSAIE